MDPADALSLTLESLTHYSSCDTNIKIELLLHVCMTPAVRLVSGYILVYPIYVKFGRILSAYIE